MRVPVPMLPDGSYLGPVGKLVVSGGAMVLNDVPVPAKAWSESSLSACRLSIFDWRVCG